MRTGLVLDEVQPKLRDLVTRLFQKVPSGLGSEGAIEHLSKKELRRLIVEIQT